MAELCRQAGLNVELRADDAMLLGMLSARDRQKLPIGFLLNVAVDEQMQFGENLSFTPWHSVADLRPLGGINRTRRKVYAAISARRHELNGVPEAEPLRIGTRTIQIRCLDDASVTTVCWLSRRLEKSIGSPTPTVPRATW